MPGKSTVGFDPVHSFIFVAVVDRLRDANSSTLGESDFERHPEVPHVYVFLAIDFWGDPDIS